MSDNTQAPRPAQPRNQHAYEELRRRLLLGEFTVTTRLAEERIGRLLGISRTPVREALLRLRAEGLVQRVDGSYFPVEPNLTDLAELYELRILLEETGLRRTVHLGGHNLVMLNELRDRWKAMAEDLPAPSPNFVNVDESFHITLLQASGNNVFVEHLQSVNTRIRLVRMYDFLTADRIDWTIQTHLNIVQAVLDDALEDAVGHLLAHIRESLSVVERRATRALRQMVQPAITPQPHPPTIGDQP